MVIFAFNHTVVTYDTIKLRVIVPSSLEDRKYYNEISFPRNLHIPHILQTMVHNLHILSTFHVYHTHTKLLHEHSHNTKIYSLTSHLDTHLSSTTYYVLTTLVVLILRIVESFLKVCVFPRNTSQCTIFLSLVL